MVPINHFLTNEDELEKLLGETVYETTTSPFLSIDWHCMKCKFLDSPLVLVRRKRTADSHITGLQQKQENELDQILHC